MSYPMRGLPIDAKILKFTDMWKTFEIILQNVTSGYSLNGRSEMTLFSS